MLLRSILVTLCITAQVKVYFITRQYLRQAQVHPPGLIPMQQTVVVVSKESSPVPANQPEQINAGAFLSLDCPAVDQSIESQHSSTLSANKNAPFFVHRRNKTVSKLELEASLTLVIGVLSLCVITSKFKMN